MNDAPRLLLVDDDEVFSSVLAQSLSRRGYVVTVAHSAEEGARGIADAPPDYAVVDLHMGGASGLTLVAALRARSMHTRIVVLTGYASIATAVEAIKLGATHYLAKPADADEIIAALRRDHGDVAAPLAEQPMSVDRLEWEHMQKVLNDAGGNISEAARRLGMHRRTLQRKLYKRPVKR